VKPSEIIIGAEHFMALNINHILYKFCKKNRQIKMCYKNIETSVRFVQVTETNVRNIFCKDNQNGG
jgi:hypothetical protein